MYKVELAIVCFSGGHSSALVAIEAVRKYGKNNVVLLNHDISSHVEHQDIKRFKDDVSNYCDVPITYANAPGFENMPPLEVCKKKSGFSVGNQQKFCTSVLKTEPFYKYLEAIPKNPAVQVLYGFDSDEPDRITRKKDIIRAMGYSVDFPIAAWSRTLEFTEDIGIRRPSTYRIFRHANCTGCLKAGRQHWYCTYCVRLDIFEEAKQAEEEIGHGIIDENVYMGELEQKFKHMHEELRICPDDKTDPNTFWAIVENMLPEQESLLPCDCSF